MKKPLSALMGLLLALWGCAPAFSRHSLDQVDTQISFQTLLQDPDRYRDRTVMCGGEIIQTRAEANETRVEVLQKPLDWRTGPRTPMFPTAGFSSNFQGSRTPPFMLPGGRLR